MYHTHELINEVLSCCSFATEVCVWKMWKRNDCHWVNLHFSIENWKVHFWFLIKDANCTVLVPQRTFFNVHTLYASKELFIYALIILKRNTCILTDKSKNDSPNSFFFLFTPQNLSLITPWWRQNSFEADLV